jgi:hypothetical protein
MRARMMELESCAARAFAFFSFESSDVDRFFSVSAAAEVGLIFSRKSIATRAHFW